MDQEDVNIKQYFEWEKDLPEAPPEAVARAKNLIVSKSVLSCPHCGKKITPFKSSLKGQQLKNIAWLGLAVGGFVASFIFKGYFLQGLAVAVIFGFKWAVEQKATKTQIMIYKALERESDSSRLHDLHH